MISTVLSLGMSMAAFAASSVAVRRTGQWLSSSFRQGVAAYAKYARNKQATFPALRETFLHYTSDTQISRAKKFMTRMTTGAREQAQRRLSPTMYRAMLHVGKSAREEVNFLPANYLMYRMEKHRAVSPEEREATSSFMKYYVGAPMALSVGMGAAMHNMGGWTKSLMKRMARKTTAQQRQRAVKVVHTAAGVGSYVADLAVAAARTRRRMAGEYGYLSAIRHQSPTEFMRRVPGAFRSERNALMGEKTKFERLSDELVQIKKTFDERSVNKTSGKYAAYRATLEKEHAMLEMRAINHYRSQFKSENSFTKFMNEIARDMNDPQMRIRRQTVQHKGIELPEEYGRWQVGDTKIDFGRMSVGFLKDALIKSSGRSIPEFSLRLFGQKELMEYKHSEHALGLAYTATRQGRLFFPTAYFDESGRSAGSLLRSVLGIGKGSSGPEREAARMFYTSRINILREETGGKLRDNQLAQVLKLNLMRGGLPINSRDMLIHHPGGALEIMTDVFDTKTRQVMPMSFRLGGTGEGSYMSFLKFTREGNSIPTRVLRNFLGHSQAEFRGQRGERVMVSAGPSQEGSIVREVEKGSFLSYLKDRLDLGFSRTRPVLDTILSAFRKHADPRYPTTFLDRRYIGDPLVRREIAFGAREGFNYNSANRMTAEAAHLFYEESRDQMEYFVANLSSDLGSRNRLIDLVGKFSDKAYPSGMRPSEFMISNTMPADVGKQRVKDFEEAVKRISGSGRGVSYIDEDLNNIRRVRELFYTGGGDKVGDYLAHLKGDSMRVVGGKMSRIPRIDEYNATVLRMIVGLSDAVKDGLAGAGADIARDSLSRDAVHELAAGLGRHASTNKLSAFMSASHMSKLHHRLGSEIRVRSTRALSEQDLTASMTRVNDVLTAFNGSADYRDVLNYYRGSKRHLPFLPWGKDTRKAIEGVRQEEIYLLPKGQGTGMVSKRQVEVDGTMMEIAHGTMSAGNIGVMSLFHAFNRTASEVLGIGLDESTISTPGQFFKKQFTKRVVPFVSAYLGLSVVDRFMDHTMDGTPFGEGLFTFGANVLAGARVAAQGMLDIAGVTSASKYLEDLMPGIIESPFGGVVRGIGPVALGMGLGFKGMGSKGGIMGGMIGAGVGALLGGGPLGLFGMWDITKSRGEVLDELTGRTPVAVRKGRFWELGCLAENSPVRCQEGWKSASDVQVGDRVLDRDGGYSKVVKVFERQHAGKLFKINTYFNLDKCAILTGNHIVPCLRKYHDDIHFNIVRNPTVEELRVDQLHSNDFLEIPVPVLSESVNSLVVSDFLNDRVIVEGQYIAATQRNWYNGNQQRSGNWYPNIIPLNRDFGRLCGYFLAEGNLYGSTKDKGYAKTIETVHAITEEEYVEDIRRICKDILDVDITVRHKCTGELTKEGCFIVRICSSIYARLFCSLFYGGGSHDKDIPDLFMQAPREFKQGIVEGYWRGDGHTGYKRKIISSCRYSLVEKIQTILLSLGHIAAIPRMEENDKRGKYRIGWNPDKSLEDKHQGFVFHEGRLYAKIKSIETFEGSGIVYDYEIDHPDHLFVTGAFLVHNSTPFEGTRIEYFRPHIYALTRSAYQDVPGLKDGIFSEMIGKIAPDYFALKNYYSRPYPATAGLLPDLPIFSSMASMLPGFPLGGGIAMHEDDWSPDYVRGFAGRMGISTPELSRLYSEREGGYGTMGPGGQSRIPDAMSMASESPLDRSDLTWAMGETFSSMEDIVGLRGFLLGSAFAGVTGRDSLFDWAPEMANPTDIAGFRRSFWDLSLGGMAGASEIIRRYLPHRRNQMQVLNPITNAMPEWLPGHDYYIDFRHGDPYTAVPLGEARLPGASYETLHDVHLAFPVDSEILEMDEASQIAHYLGFPEYMAERNKRRDQVASIKDELIDQARSYGDLVRSVTSLYNPKMDIHATVDAVLRDAGGGSLPVKVSPKGYGGAATLNAYMALGDIDKGLLLEVDTETGAVTEQLLRKDIVRFNQGIERARKAQQAAYSQVTDLEREGKAMNLGNAYSWFDRYRILSDVAHWSAEYREADAIVKQQMLAGTLPADKVGEYQQIQEQVRAKSKAFQFDEYRFLELGNHLTPAGKELDRSIAAEYSKPEQMIGAAWEYLSHLRTPLHSKLLHQTSSLEEYENTAIYGKRIKMWENPYEDFIKSYWYRMTSEDDPVQSALSWATGGMLLGGLPLAGATAAIGALSGTFNAVTGRVPIPERTVERREIAEQMDAVKYAKYKRLYSETGDRAFLRKAQSSATGMAMDGDTPNLIDLQYTLGYPERDFVDDIVRNVTSSNVDKVSKLLPPIARAALYAEIGMPGVARGTMDEFRTALDDRHIPEYESSVYSPDVDLELPLIRTMENEGLNAHDAGAGWYNQVAAMSRLERLGMMGPSDDLYGNRYESRYTIRDFNAALSVDEHLRRRLAYLCSNVQIFQDGQDRVEVEIIT